MIQELTRISDVLHAVESYGPIACDGNCDPEFDLAIADAKVELVSFEQSIEAEVDPTVLADPALIAEFEPSIAALEAKAAELAPEQARPHTCAPAE